MPYDHHVKAGNEGDIVKHPALIAVLDVVLSQKKELLTGRPGVTDQFHYLDMFAGHAWHPLIDENTIPGIQKGLEWKNGIGVLFKNAESWPDARLNMHVQCWRDWYLPKRPSLVGGWYPGSSLIAADMCRKHRRPIRMTLFDTSDQVREDLTRFFQPAQPSEQFTKNDWCVIGRSLNPTAINQTVIQEPDFVFIDPPRLEEWETVRDHVLQPRQKQHRPTLVWLPIAGNDRAFDGEPQRELKEAADLGYDWHVVRWEQHSDLGSACALICNYAHKEIRAAVECIVELMQWGQVREKFAADRSSLPIDRASHDADRL